MRPLANWCAKHRFIVIAMWLSVLVATFFAQSTTGSNYAAGTKLSGTPSAAAANLLQRAAPSQAGDSERIVFEARTGTVTTPAVRAAVETVLGRVAKMPYVGEVTSPYSGGGGRQISATGAIAYATVDFTKDANSIPASEATNLVDVARASNSPTLQVDVVGDVAASTNPSSTSTATLFGVVAALIVLLLVFRSLLAALLPLVGTAIALLSGLSVIGILSNSLSMASFTSQLCILIGLGVGIDYSLFVLTRVRTGLRRGLGIQEAVGTASATAGRAVLFAGITVCIALLGMLTVGVGVLSGAAIAASIAVLFPMAGAQTLLPALVGVLGQRVLTRRQRAALARGETDFPEASPRWSAWARRVQTRRLGFGFGALALLVVIGAPFFSMRQGTADYSTDPTNTNTTTYRAYELLVKGFGPGMDGPLQLVAVTPTPSEQATFASVVSSAERAPGVVTGTAAKLYPAAPGHPAVSVAELFPASSPQAAATSQLIHRLRATVIPEALHGRALHVLVGGQTALADDEASQLSSKLPLFVGMVVALSFIVLMVVFRSLAIPATAAVMNLLSAGAAFGVIVAVFQWGWLSSLIGVSHTGPVSPLVPILMFAVLFGLSMDYEVFLVSRMHEEWLERGSNSEAVNRGQAVTGRTITAAASIMIVVFASFMLSTDRTIKMIGLGMAAAIAIDALVVRTILVPAAMHTIGNANWHLPAALERRLPRLQLEESSEHHDDGARSEAVGAR